MGPEQKQKMSFNEAEVQKALLQNPFGFLHISPSD